MEASFPKTRRDSEEAGLSLIRHEHIFQKIKEEHKEHDYSITVLCKLGRAFRAAYYKWLHREIPENEYKNRRIADEIEKIYIGSPDQRYRRIRDDLECYHDISVNDNNTPEPSSDDTSVYQTESTDKNTENTPEIPDNESQQQISESYALNTSSMKIHKPSCSAAKKIAPENYSTSNSSISELEAQGYGRCGICLK